jgi:hypothetical protein
MMWQRLSRDDFDKTSDLMGGGSSNRMWQVCEEYELKRLTDPPVGDPDRYFVVPKYSREPSYFNKWRSYEPLEDTPDLFLKFARLHGAEDRDDAMLAWVRNYGTLGHGKPRWVAGAPQDAKGFWEAVDQAAGVLALYEAVLNGDKERARSTILEEFPNVTLFWQLGNELSEKSALMDREWVSANISDTVAEIYDGDYLWYALETAAENVRDKVAPLCSLALTVEEGARDVSGVRTGWSFMSLLGAMYLQMYWLMAAGSDLTRCEHCGRLISLARPNPEGRKRRRDKRFCDDACRQAHHRSKKRDQDSPS